jgi:hypothetical protein
MHTFRRFTSHLVVRFSLFAIAGFAFALILYVLTLTVSAQCPNWSCNGSLMYYNSGNVGIGTTSPQQLLHIASVTPWIQIEDTSPAQKWRLGVTSNALYIYDQTDNRADMVFNGAGNVGIGTTSPQSKLAVNGTVTAKEVVVTVSGWSDSVLATDYSLPSLESLENHIQTHGTLPGIPSETEVLGKGVAVGEMQAKLLAKVEELTLYVIQLKKENVRLKDENDSFEQRLKVLEERLQ